MMRTRQTMAPMPIVTFIVLFVIVTGMRAQVCTINPPQGPVAIYDESLLPGWSTPGSWNIAAPVNMQATPGGQDGNRAIQVDFNANWGGIELHRNNVGTTFLDSLVFRVRQEGTGVLYAGIRLTSTNTLHNWVAVGSYIMPHQTIVMTPGQWYVARIPLADMGLPAGTSINGVLIESSTPMTIYLDDVGIVTALLQFPLYGTGTTPYNAPISAILDHSVDTSQGNSGYYHQNGTILAYNWAYSKEVGTGSNLCRYFIPNSTISDGCDGNNHSIVGYLKDLNGSSFTLPLLNFQSEDSVYPGKELLWYDGHSGYDYPTPIDTPVYPATIGMLCVASIRTAPDGAGSLWRNQAMCPYGTDSIVWPNPVNGDSWDSWHMFYIVYPNEYAGITYSTWYLHSRDLEPNVKQDILANGYSNVVNTDNPVSLSGDTAPPDRPVGPHLHFEMRQNGIKEIDPYGDGSPGNFLVLWQARPQ